VSILLVSVASVETTTVVTWTRSTGQHVNDSDLVNLPLSTTGTALDYHPQRQPCVYSQLPWSIMNHSGLPVIAPSLKQACIKAHCTSKLGPTMAVDLVCAAALCSSRRQLAATELPVVELDQMTEDESTSPEAVLAAVKRAGFTDTAGACMAFHCAGKSPGTLEFLLCASRNRCAGWTNGGWRAVCMAPLSNCLSS